MELKCVSNNDWWTIYSLLIVPNGIEIYLWKVIVFSFKSVNRTKWNWNIDINNPLLTLNNAVNRTKWNWNVVCFINIISIINLLIVPNGIEMLGYWLLLLQLMHSVNRTKWNWNLDLAKPAKKAYRLLIVPNGIEIQIQGLFSSFSYSVNRTKWNWNQEES